VIRSTTSSPHATTFPLFADATLATRDFADFRLVVSSLTARSSVPCNTRFAGRAVDNPNRESRSAIDDGLIALNCRRPKTRDSRAVSTPIRT
jgi:hypothetical protein